MTLNTVHFLLCVLTEKPCFYLHLAGYSPFCLVLGGKGTGVAINIKDGSFEPAWTTPGH